jgi:MSHA pilin protein MshC
MIRASNNRGFTIVELVVVIVVLGIISAVAVPKFFDLKGYEEIAFRDELVSALRFAQKRAVASGKKVEVDITSNGFSLQFEDGTPVKHPAGGDFTNSEESSIALTPQNFTFDALGRADKLGSDGTENKFSNIGYNGSNITVWRETGCVEVN